MNQFAQWFIIAGTILGEFNNPVAKAIGAFLVSFGVTLNGGGGTIPVFDIGDFAIGPIPIVKK
jgi:hypothetical protein